ncbi:MAG TPA: glycosyltransferase family 2 protein [Polyangiales bacterium]|nr:glycosyltransferase family 2 protein [Polyangiales bacterium]
MTLTLNERVHIERCIKSSQRFAKQVFVVDSGSTDGTQEIAQSLGAHVTFHAWENNYARQLNWGIDNLPIDADWILRLDADEWVSEELAQELNEKLDKLPPEITGVILPRRQYSFGKWLKWGMCYPIYTMRIWRRGHGRCEERWMDEHMVLFDGTTVTFDHDFADENLKPLAWWTTKQANYAVREAADMILSRENEARYERERPEDPSSRRKRWAKVYLYRKVPPFLRPLGFFVYRYFIRLGFLDGVPGLLWHVLQAFWYRFLVDAVVYDVERRARETGMTPVDVIEKVYGLKLSLSANAAPALATPAAKPEGK